MGVLGDEEEEVGTKSVIWPRAAGEGGGVGDVWCAACDATDGAVAVGKGVLHGLRGEAGDVDIEGCGGGEL